MKEPISWQAEICSGNFTTTWDIVDAANDETIAKVYGTTKPIVDKRNAHLMARAGRLQAAIKAVVTVLDAHHSAALAREIRILRNALK